MVGKFDQLQATKSAISTPYLCGTTLAFFGWMDKARSTLDTAKGWGNPPTSGVFPVLKALRMLGNDLVENESRVI